MTNGTNVTIHSVGNYPHPLSVYAMLSDVNNNRNRDRTPHTALVSWPGVRAALLVVHVGLRHTATYTQPLRQQKWLSVSLNKQQNYSNGGRQESS